MGSETEADARAESLWSDVAGVFDYQGLPGVSGDRLREFHTPVGSPAGVEFERSVVYGTAGVGGRELDMFLFRRVDSAERRPMVLFVHGGAWAAMHPNMHLRHAHALAAAGYVTASISYRLSDEAIWPAALEDCKCAVRWLRAHADSLGGDPDGIAIAGGSAGGHLALLVALTPGEYEGTGGWPDVSSGVQAVATWYPVVDLTGGASSAETEVMIDVFLGKPTEARRRDASPISYLRSDAPPTLVMTGGADPVVPPAAVIEFAESLRDVSDSQVELHVEPGGLHGYDLIPGLWQSDFRRLSRFLNSTLSRDPAGDSR